MNKKLVVLTLTGALAFSLALPAMASEPVAVPISAAASVEDIQQLPASVLYYGTVQEIVKGEDGAISQLRLTSERYGEYVMHISEQTVWIDSGLCKASNAEDLQVGEGIYVFHSPAETSSLPPQSAAFAVVRNVPMDAGCAQYHVVEEAALENGQLTITTSNGGLLLRADSETPITQYGTDKALTLEDIRAGDRVMAWYGAVAQSEPAQAQATQLMLLPREEAQPAPAEEQETMTRAELVTLLHEKAGKPVVNYLMNYQDVSEDAPYAEAIRWATSEGLVSGYGSRTFGPDDIVTREQLVTILWRYAGSPMLMDYTGLTQFDDVGEISPFAQPAFAWAHQKGYMTAVEGNLLKPQSSADDETVNAMIDAVTAANA